MSAVISFEALFGTAELHAAGAAAIEKRVAAVLKEKPFAGFTPLRSLAAQIAMLTHVFQARIEQRLKSQPREAERLDQQRLHNFFDLWGRCRALESMLFGSDSDALLLSSAEATLIGARAWFDRAHMSSADVEKNLLCKAEEFLTSPLCEEARAKLRQEVRQL